MARIVLHKLDRIITQLTLLLIIGSGTIIHTLTALTIRSYYGDPWGYVAFLLPGIAEAYLVFVQLDDRMYNYSIIVATFATAAFTLTLILLVKKLVRAKVETLLEKKASLS